MPAAPTSHASGTASAGQVRVMVVDDSAVIRGVITRILEEHPGIKVVASVANAAVALSMLPRAPVDVVILDIEMPVLDGLTALPQILRVAPDVKVIMASTLTQRGGEISLEALRLGAIDFVPKPTVGSIFGAADFKREIVEKVSVLGRAGARRAPAVRAPAERAAGPRSAPVAPVLDAATAVRLRSASRVRPLIIGIGSSTGGPQALQTLLTSLPASLRQPIVIVQHMPPTFTRLLADQLGRIAKRPTCEGADGMVVAAGHVYIAPGGFHMRVERNPGDAVLRVVDGPPENFCRPSVDPLFRSLASAYGPAALAVVLTGMGSDGAHGAEAIAAAGGTVLAQDEATSVVWGMPGAAAAAGVCSALVPLPEFGRRLGDFAAGTVR